MKFVPDKPLYIFWSGSNADRSPTLRGADGFTLRPATDYLESIVETHKQRPAHTARSNVDRHTYAIAEFCKYLLLNDITLEKINDNVIIQFRDWATERVRGNKVSRGFEHQYQATVNHKLVPIYDMLDWLLENGLVEPDTIGWNNCKVKSSLPEHRIKPDSENSKSSNKYPKLFRNIGENSRESPNQYWATANDVKKLEEFFWQASAEVALRNSTMLRLVDILAWRMGSANSILSTQFSALAFNQRKSQETYIVTPQRQKGGYQKPFSLSWPLAQQIRNYIEDTDFGRAALMKKFGRCEAEVNYQVWLSAKNGMPLQTTSWVAIFSDAFSAIGAPKGAGGHAIRRGTASRCSDETIASLQEAGLPVTEDAVVIDTQERLGHSSRSAQSAYRRATRRRRKTTVVDKMSVEIEDLKVKSDELRLQLANAKARVADLELQLENARKPKKRRGAKAAKAST